MSDPRCELVGWDTQFFGFQIARITADRLSGTELSSILLWCGHENIRCLYWLVGIADPATVRLAEEHSFHLVDVRVTLETESLASHARPSHARIAREDDLPAIIAIARTAYAGSRFYNDPNFTSEQCEDLYATWTENSFRGYADRVYVIDADRPAGYITCHYRDGIGSIGLIAVADWARGRGLGSELVSSSLQFFADSGARTASVVTQGGNISAQRLYQRCGFLTRSIQLWYHRWSST